MGRPSKGDRGAHTVKLHPDVTQRLVDMACTAGASSLSQYTADVLALHVGLPQYVVELNQATLLGAGTPIRKSIQANVMIRPHRAVSEQLFRLAIGNGFPPGFVSPYIAGVLAEHVGLPAHAPIPDRKEVLPLAI